MTPKQTAEKLIKQYSKWVTTWDCYNDAPEQDVFVRQDALECSLNCAKTVFNNCKAEKVIHWHEVIMYLKKELNKYKK